MSIIYYVFWNTVGIELLLSNLLIIYSKYHFYLCRPSSTLLFAFFLICAAPGKNYICWSQRLNYLVGSYFLLSNIDLIRRVCLQIPIYFRSSFELLLIGGHTPQFFRKLFFFCKRSKHLFYNQCFFREMREDHSVYQACETLTEEATLCSLKYLSVPKLWLLGPNSTRAPIWKSINGERGTPVPMNRSGLN